MRRKRRGAFFVMIRICGLFVVGLVVALIIALSQVNLETLRGNVLAILRDATGMPVEIDGAVSWKFSLRPRIELHQVRIPNAEWAHHEYAFSADKIDVTINLMSLFEKRPTIQNVRIHDATVCIERNNAGEYSIMPQSGGAADDDTDDMADKADKPDDIADADAVPEKPKYPFEDPGLGGVEIRNLTAHIMDQEYSVSGLNVRYFPRRSGREYSGWIRSPSDVYPFIVSFSEYNAERKVYPVRVALSTGGRALIGNIALEGTSRIPIDFKITGEIPNMAKMGALVGLNWPDTPEMSIDLAGGYDWRKISFRKSTVDVIGLKITFSGVYDWRKKVPNITLNLETPRLVLYDVFPDLYARRWTRPNRALNVFKGIPLYGDEFLKYNLDLHLEIDEFVVYRDFSIDEMDVKLKLHDGAGRLDGDIVIGDGDIRVGADIDIAPDGNLDVVASATGTGVIIGNILTQLRFNDMIGALPVDFKLHLRGTGATLEELMSTATGPVQIYSTGPGYVSSNMVSTMYGGDFLTSLRHSIEDLFRSDKQHNHLSISCVSVNAKLRNGRIETQHGVALETNAINVRLAGNVDLGAETMHMSITTVPVRGLKLSLTGNVVNSMEITGSLAEPDVKISGAAVAGKVASATGLGLLLAPFTGGIGFVAVAGAGLLAGDLLENWLADDEPCKTAMRRGAPAMRGDELWLNAPIDELVNATLDKENEQ